MSRGGATGDPDKVGGPICSLEASGDAAEEASRPIPRFFTDAAQQLRAPITSAQASVEALLRGADPAEQDRLFGLLVQDTARASNLLGSLLRVIDLDTGLAVSPQPCDLVALAREEVDRSWGQSPQLDIALRSGLPADLRPELDPEVVREALGNLLDNARRRAAERVLVAIGYSDGVVELRVTGNGPRPPEGAGDEDFEGAVSADPEGGSGLGLAIASRLARAHGGHLRWEAGSFVLRLPAGGAGAPVPTQPHEG
ncbi:MAG TPA: HAMP domain-containing sensor histidine kinase [Acidimicrobiales bacterium]|nr:HAMP domain-containing sensor histidine kinase [Acidimicrobiales bacterium]